MIPAGHTAVMASRREPPDSLDYFPTPPWATRALILDVLPALGDALPAIASAADPASGEGHMVEVLREFYPDVRASDVFDYGRGYDVADFLDARKSFAPVDLLATNPPFNAALAFVLRGLTVAKVVAILVRTSWIEGERRYSELFRERPPTLYAQFVERVPMVKGRWDPAASTATAYAWIVWVRDAAPRPLFLIPPGRKRALTRPDDVRRFAVAAETPLFADEV
ncbi:hypothetical protein [Methylobacterium gnaphalii]|uniref:Methyltransferase n=1 Tax=Methylobacterium gnaphalii TaxID=1010610 RepID=A0A512JQN2_9HYPH|nr:hypothetical protein [Methylobacterium gnaphalii]GEP12270.1 hypothetical protein MGN01_41150 [Methylobacterium gnaphalii]GJD68727.1 hypothetical protein MMMDOFMJ_1651 [Methylobacterium gnaphalii]GLS49377.1 hypothetical protein GCM10007885_22250 [Methylobacterium gnaphalii]